MWIGACDEEGLLPDQADQSDDSLHSNHLLFSGSLLLLLHSGRLQTDDEEIGLFEQGGNA